MIVHLKLQTKSLAQSCETQGKAWVSLRCRFKHRDSLIQIARPIIALQIPQRLHIGLVRTAVRASSTLSIRFGHLGVEQSSKLEQRIIFQCSEISSVILNL